MDAAKGIAVPVMFVESRIKFGDVIPKVVLKIPVVLPVIPRFTSA